MGTTKRFLPAMDVPVDETTGALAVQEQFAATIAASLASILAKLSDPATQTTLAAVLAKLSADPATQTTLAAVLAKLSADPATQTTLAAVLAKLSADPATQTTLAAVLAKLSADPATQTTLAAVLALLTGAHGNVAAIAAGDATTPATWLAGLTDAQLTLSGGQNGVELHPTGTAYTVYVAAKDNGGTWRYLAGPLSVPAYTAIPLAVRTHTALAFGAVGAGVTVNVTPFRSVS